ncbi:hypothetical protein LPJ75_001111 [Coemansia sp. RSA 2598]|nr:hypothetical protein LPJ75_001111 [Coemansia sp. RSA 2598]
MSPGEIHGQPETISLLLPDLQIEREAEARTTTPLDMARKYAQKSAKKYIIAVINDSTPWDMQRPLPVFARSLRFMGFDSNSAMAQEVFWHSSAHVMGAALEKIYGDDLLLCDGPAQTDGGFFYEFLLHRSSQAQSGLLVDRLDRSTHFGERIRQMCGTSESLESLGFLSSSDLHRIERTATELVSQKSMFERMEVEYDVARDMFLDNPFKLHFIDRALSNARSQGRALLDSSDFKVSLYRCGKMIDLCRGPHVVHTAQLQAFKISRLAAAHWVGHLNAGNADAAESGDSGDPLGAGSQQKRPVLNRIYGISFPTHDMLKDYQNKLDEAARRDHRSIGKEQKLFMMHPWAPGSGFILPNGTRMVNTILGEIRRKYAKYGFDEVSTPLMYNRKLWETSGHWDKYREDMFGISSRALAVSIAQPKTQGAEEAGCCSHGAQDAKADGDGAAGEESEFCLKPMNCPGHCLIFASELRSYRDLPIRYADFSPLHRNEVAGALSGLTRVRKFHQDDGHIFCARDQVADEIQSCLRLVDEMYSMFKFPSYEVVLSTRPQSYIGEISEWDEAEGALKAALDSTGMPWSINEGDGAFYGPKIDVRVQDALGRKHQTATIQLDFQLPQRFQLKYTGADGRQHRPVMIHRAVLGSMERMLAILIEHWGGKWPFWINPRQAIVIPTTTAAGARDIVEYAQKVRDTLANDVHAESVDSHRFFVDIDLSGNTLNRAVREAQLAQYSFILVVGEKELRSETIDVRPRQGARIGAKTVAETKAMFQDLVERFC